MIEVAEPVHIESGKPEQTVKTQTRQNAQNAVSDLGQDLYCLPFIKQCLDASACSGMYLFKLDEIEDDLVFDIPSNI